MSVNQKAFTLLVSMGAEAGPAIAKRDAMREKVQGAYDLGVQAAVECGDLATFRETIEKLEDDIRFNRDNLAVRFKAKKRKSESETGEKYLIPSSVSTVKAALIFSFEHGVPLVKDGKPDTFGGIRKANSAERSRIERDRGQTLKGDDLARWQVQHGARALLEKAGKMEAEQLAAAVAALKPWIPATAPAAPAHSTLETAAGKKRGPRKAKPTADGQRAAA